MEKLGKIVKIISNLYSVDTDGIIHQTRARGKFRNDDVTPLVGDFVVIDDETDYILKIEKRRNELSRPPVANVDIGLIITSAKEPDLSLSLLDKELLVIEAEDIEPVIVLTKLDLLTNDERSEIEDLMEYYRSIGYKVFTNQQVEQIKNYLKNKTVVLTGQTGAGKSTMLNKLDESLNLKVSPISKALGRGVHTTRHVELYEIGDIFFADTPGFSALDLKFPRENLKYLFPEFVNKTCKFKDCEHDHEKVCGVKSAVEEGSIIKSRYENYLKFRGEMK